MPSRTSTGTCAGPIRPISTASKRQIDDKTKAIFIESLANPGGTFVDIAAIAAVAHKHGLPLIVDNTMATPYLIRPIEHGADIVVHSLTKFMGGHGNSMGGIIVDGGTFDWSKSGKYPMLSEPRPEYDGMVLHETFGNFAFAIACRVLGLRDLGPAISPFNAFLILTGIETLPLRMQRHCDNALAVAKWLKSHPKVAWVNYAGLPGRSQPCAAAAIFAQGRRRGLHLRPEGRLRGRHQRCVEGLKLFSHLANIGDTRSLVIHPASTTHRQLTPEQQIGGRCRSGRGAPVGRHRGRRRHHRRSRTGTRQGLISFKGGRTVRPPTFRSTHVQVLTFDPAAITPEIGAPAPDRLISGNPQFRTWNFEEAEGGLYAGIWEATPGKWRIVYDEWEYFHILSGYSIVTEDEWRSDPSEGGRQPDPQTRLQGNLGSD